LILYIFTINHQGYHHSATDNRTRQLLLQCIATMTLGQQVAPGKREGVEAIMGGCGQHDAWLSEVRGVP
jgi:hypothetical protein